MRIGAILGCILALVAWTGNAQALGQRINLVERSIQLIGFGLYQAQDGTGRDVCFAYVGIRESDRPLAYLVDVADMAFEEIVAAACGARFLQNSETGKTRIVPDAWIVVGPALVLLEDPNRWLGAQLGPNPLGVRVEYRRLDDIGVDILLDARGQPLPEYQDSEFQRVSHQDIPVGPSRREPNGVAQPTEIIPGVTIGLENTTEITYAGHRKPTLLVLYQTDVSVTDRGASQALAEQVAHHFGGTRLEAGNLEAVRTGAYNEPKRSRFHYRLSYGYNLTGKRSPRDWRGKEEDD